MLVFFATHRILRRMVVRIHVLQRQNCNLGFQYSVFGVAWLCRQCIRQGLTFTALTCGSKCKGCTAMEGKKPHKQTCLAPFPLQKAIWVVRWATLGSSPVREKSTVVSCEANYTVDSFFLVLCSLGIHKLVIILYLQCGFNALSFRLVDTVDWSLFCRFFFINIH